MFNQKTKKYRLLAKESVTRHGDTYEVHRIQALIDIPLHGVKKGDMGGFVAHKNTLSHSGNAWVGGDAVAYYYQNAELISGDALVDEQAFVARPVSGTSKVYGNAYSSSDLMRNCDISGNARVVSANLRGNIIVKDNVEINGASIEGSSDHPITISGDVKIDKNRQPGRDNTSMFSYDEEIIDISGEVTLDEVSIKGTCRISNTVQLLETSLQGDNTIFGNANIMPGSKFTGTNNISGDSVIPPGSRVHNIVMSTGVLNYGMLSPEVPHVPTESAIDNSSISEETQEYINIINDTEKEYEAYTTDIVKLIKYPAMADATIPAIKNFLYTLRSAKRAIKSGKAEKIADMAESVEKSFLEAENIACTLVSSHLDDKKKDALKKAGQMFALAADEASPDPEKRLSVKAGLRSLEGVIIVSDEAIDVLKNRLGLRELEV
jgi:cytoskeletal protein CcmA (bactofilin family)